MKVALHSAPKGFFKSNPPHSSSELCRLVRKAASLSFKCFQVGPLSDFVDIDGKRVRRVLDQCDMERNVHVGGLFDAKKLAVTDEEYERVRDEIHYGIELCREISSSLVSFHPPFFTTKDPENNALSSEARARFLKLVREEAKFACNSGVKMALESFCYQPFILNSLGNFVQFVSDFPPTKIGVLLEVGHLHQARFDLDKAVQAFSSRLLDVHIHDATKDKDFRKATHLPIGKGNIDIHHLIETLHEVKYDEWLTLEIRGSEREIVESKRFLERLSKRKCKT